jgi:hypothetical protein
MSLRTLALASVVLAASSAAAQSGAPLSASPAAARDSRTTVPKVPADPKVAAVRQIPTRVNVLKPKILIAQKDSICYALRTYQFDQPTPASDGTRMTGQSTCVPAKTSNAIAIVTPR